MRAEAVTRTSVLVVEDDFVLLEIVTRIFERAGLRVHQASGGEAALTILRDNGPAIDWLFTDVNLPGLVDGWVVAAEYRLSHPFRPVIYSSSAQFVTRRTVHGSIFVEKPFDPAHILNLAQMMESELAPAAPDGAGVWSDPPELRGGAM